MKIKNTVIYLLVLFYSIASQAQDENKWDFENDFFIGSQAFILFTPLLDPSPEYYQLNFGYRFSAKDELSVEAITWTFQGPQGRPLGSDHESEDSNFPGDIKALGGGLSYKRMVWKGAYAQIHSTAFRQIYRDMDKNKIQTGFQLFNTMRFGYHFKIFKDKWYIAPSVAFTYWPINTNLPESFQVEEDKWPNYFLFEPGLQFGFTF